MATEQITPRRRVIQIATSESDDDRMVLALCDDGTLWRYKPTGKPDGSFFWAKLPPVPGAGP